MTLVHYFNHAWGGNTHTEKKRCTADQTDVTELPAHSACSHQNKPPVQAEGVKRVSQSPDQQLGFIGGSCDHESKYYMNFTLICPCFPLQPPCRSLRWWKCPPICSLTWNTQMTTKIYAGYHEPIFFLPCRCTQLRAPRCSQLSVEWRGCSSTLLGCKHRHWAVVSMRSVAF